METEFYTLELTKKELESLSLFHQLAFAAACCERLLPNYYIFAREEGWIDQMLLRKALDEVWQILSGKEMDISTINQLLLECDEIFPKQQYAFHSEYANEGIIAAQAIYLTLEFCLETNLTQLMLIVSQLTNTLYQYLDWRFHEEQYPFWDEKPLLHVSLA